MPEYLGLSAVADSCQEYCRLDARKGGSLSVLKAARMIAAAGGEPLAVTDCLNFGNPEDPEVMEDFSQGVDGIREACLALQVPVVSGNVSLYNETDGKSIVPTPMIGMVGRHLDIRHALPAVLKKGVLETPGKVYMLHGRDSQAFLAGSLFEKELVDSESRFVPEIFWDAELEGMSFVRALGSRGLALACRDVGKGGLACTTMKMLSGSGYGIEYSDHFDLKSLFGNRLASWVFVVPPGQEVSLREAAKSLNVTSLSQVGELNHSEVASWQGHKVNMETAGDLSV